MLRNLLLRNLLRNASIIYLVASTAVWADSVTESHPQTKTAPLHQTQSPGKPNAGLAITSGSRYQLSSGSVQTLTLSLSSAVEQGQLYVTVATDDPALELLSPLRHEFDLAQDATPELNLELLPHGDGSYYLMLNAEIIREGAPAQAQAMGVVVQVGEGEEPRLHKAESTTPGVISLPARETIR